jgi:hypothetical protein
MSFVATKFPLPTVTRADGTLGAYVQYPVNPGGPQFIWPAQRIAILLAKQKADKAKKKSGGLLGAVTSNSPLATQVFNAGPNALPDNYGDLVAAAKQPVPAQPANQGMSYALALGGIVVGGGIIIALAKAFSGRPSTGRPIPGAHVYEGL